MKHDRSKRKELYSVGDTALQVRGAQDAHVFFQVVDGISEDILSIDRAVDQGATFHFGSSESWMEWPDGARADFRREGNQFVLRYRELNNSGGSDSKVAPVEILMDDVEAQEVEPFAQREQQAAEDQAEWAELAGQDQEEPLASAKAFGLESWNAMILTCCLRRLAL